MAGAQRAWVQKSLDAEALAGLGSSLTKELEAQS